MEKQAARRMRFAATKRRAARHRKDNSMRVQTVTITPKQAEHLLTFNTHNRRLKDNVVQRYAAAMRRGEWQLNGETIKFNGKGEFKNGTITGTSSLVDGQHRLAAIALADVPVETAVATGVSMSAQETVDIGTRRTVADALKLRGEANVTTLAGALAYLYRNIHDLEHLKERHYPTIKQAIGILEDHPDIRLSISVGGRVQSQLRANPSLMTFLHYHFASIDRDDAEDFFDRLISGEGLDRYNPILTLRGTLERDIGADKRMIPKKVHAFTVKAWNAYREGRELRIMKWSPGGANPERFPKAV